MLPILPLLCHFHRHTDSPACPFPPLAMAMVVLLIVVLLEKPRMVIFTMAGASPPAIVASVPSPWFRWSSTMSR